MALGPVWETNHIWLILIVVTLFTAFPPAFAHLFTALLVPLVIALAGIIFRGAVFAFRHFGEETEERLPATGLVIMYLKTMYLFVRLFIMVTNGYKWLQSQFLSGFGRSWSSAAAGIASRRRIS